MSLLELVQGSAHQLPFLADGSVHAVITSPPYFGLRAYAGEQEIDWPAVEYAPMAGLPPVAVPAQRCALGAEAEPFAYIGHLILCLREWWRVLRADGVCMVNLGDSYNSAASNQQSGSVERPGGYNRGYDAIGRQGLRGGAIKPKNLMLIPARFALAAQADGWIVRAGIVWAKGVSFLADYAGSSMPESVQDRPSRSHEDIYLLAKRERYFWDGFAVREASLDPTDNRKERSRAGQKRLPTDQIAGVRPGSATYATRNLRSVWVINPRPFSAAHFACWPETLVDPMIRAATSERGCCPACGAAWVRVVERGDLAGEKRIQNGDRPAADERGVSPSGLARTNGRTWRETVDHGWRKGCACDAPGTVPCTVLDPFSGSATTGKVAVRLGRRYVGVDLAAEYLGAVTDVRMGDGVQMEML